MERPGLPENSNESVFETAIRKEVADYGGIVEFLRTSISERTSAPEVGVDETFRGNLRQMERIAKAVAAPRGTVFETSHQHYASAFYWGEVIGMEIGERVLGDMWSNVLYSDLSKYYLRSRNLALHEEVEPSVNESLGIASPSPDSFRSLLTANIMSGVIEESETTAPLPDELITLGQEFAAELANDEETRRYVEMGYTLVMRIFSEVRIEVLEDEENAPKVDEPAPVTLTEEEQELGKTIDDMLHWDEILGEED